MKHQDFSTRAQHASGQVDAWGRINRRYFGNLIVGGLAADVRLEAGLSVFDVGALRVLRLQAPAHRVQRCGTRGDHPTDDAYKLVLQLKGQSEIQQRDRTFSLEPGDWTLYDPRVPYSVTNFERMDLLVVQLPRDVLPGLRAQGLHARDAQSCDAQGLHAVLGAFLVALAQQLPALPDGAGRALGAGLIGLLTSAMAADRRHGKSGGLDAPGGQQATLSRVLRARVKHYVQAHLADADLNIDRVAQAMRCSKRYLHRVFEDESLSIDRYIWKSRLERCHHALGELHADRPVISQVAFAWGFNSSAHFCRMFKKQFGMTPSDYLNRRDRAAV